MRTSYDVIVRPIVTENSMMQTSDRKYTFEVLKDANKTEIRKAVEEVFGVKVEKISTMHVKGKLKRQGRNEGYTRSWKKAIVKLTEDSKTIEFFEGM
ncbi:50S ribosomal protein L23 [Fusibacter tunisiensis]|jgi:large subunit ribosomal protein L23|uniref:Large ribosomal subunit protein uL23 n=1 Tax=Fusibacter tunisiensis TaxID=1008308 RepID=A0ABS2MR53_9FIRM|nr:50S ribosomal protein L23 [Fusibacter tunisiensis]MBM7561797.1 large subunit ribosomal protein L23 [Fusibacter tunisiensis]